MPFIQQMVDSEDKRNNVSKISEFVFVTEFNTCTSQKNKHNNATSIVFHPLPLTRDWCISFQNDTLYSPLRLLLLLFFSFFFFIQLSKRKAYTNFWFERQSQNCTKIQFTCYKYSHIHTHCREIGKKFSEKPLLTERSPVDAVARDDSFLLVGARDKGTEWWKAFDLDELHFVLRLFVRTSASQLNHRDVFADFLRAVRFSIRRVRCVPIAYIQTHKTHVGTRQWQAVEVFFLRARQPMRHCGMKNSINNGTQSSAINRNKKKHSNPIDMLHWKTIQCVAAAKERIIEHIYAKRMLNFLWCGAGEIPHIKNHVIQLLRAQRISARQTPRCSYISQNFVYISMMRVLECGAQRQRQQLERENESEKWREQILFADFRESKLLSTETNVCLNGGGK